MSRPVHPGVGIAWLLSVGGGPPGRSARQGLSRGTGATEVDYLNGEIVLLGRLRGVPVPGNGPIQRPAELASSGSSPVVVPAEAVMA